MSAENLERGRITYEIYTNYSAFLYADVPEVKKPTIEWAYLSDYHNTLYVDGFPGKYYCKYTKRWCLEIIQQQCFQDHWGFANRAGNEVIICTWHIFCTDTGGLGICHVWAEEAHQIDENLNKNLPKGFIWGTGDIIPAEDNTQYMKSSDETWMLADLE